MTKSRKKNKIIEPPKPKKFDLRQIEHGGKRSGWFVIILAAAGLGICLYLYSLHVALLMGEIKSGPLCGADGGLGCQSVAASPYSSMLGLPLASWGAVFYTARIRRSHLLAGQREGLSPLGIVPRGFRLSL